MSKCYYDNRKDEEEVADILRHFHQHSNVESRASEYSEEVEESIPKEQDCSSIQDSHIRIDPYDIYLLLRGE
eukprot:CAMPEP_0170550858 /NCGR_PEP_ID=MMETSP0211-20121228/8870_1 /TAXON_ID=311385 /ORGANISM="Pseudokeronopsis sp., Strain OXSARD2" /LENGTH=71 /DNA_ID=CAMNT_0010857641 /DNA_START=113 /DNA_END=328 /DNA_ORIENTATION=-